jgi:hypothetical protein
MSDPVCKLSPPLVTCCAITLRGPISSIDGSRIGVTSSLPMNPIIVVLPKALGGFLFISLFCIASFHFLSWAIRPNARQTGDVFVLEYSTAAKVALFLCAVVFALFVLLARVNLLGELLPFVPEVATAFVIFVMLRGSTAVICYDQQGLHIRDPWRRRQFVPWNAITSVVCVRTYGYYLHAEGYGRIAVHFSLCGVQSLLRELAARGLQPQLPVSPIEAYWQWRQEQRRALKSKSVQTETPERER